MFIPVSKALTVRGYKMSIGTSEARTEAIALILKLTAPDVRGSVESLLSSLVSNAYAQGMADGFEKAAEVVGNIKVSA
jgi:hypothetical protein